MNYLCKINDILDSAVSKWVCNVACILAYLINSASRLCCVVWASYFPLLHYIKDSIPPIEAFLYSHINWLLKQVHQQSWHGVSQSSTSMKDARSKPEAGFRFYVQKLPVPKSGGVSLVEKPHVDTKLEICQGGRESAGGAFSSSTDSRKKWNCRGWDLCDTVFNFITIIFICCVGWYIFKILRSVEKHYFQ